jgi:hypothetical protein
MSFYPEFSKRLLNTDYEAAGGCQSFQFGTEGGVSNTFLGLIGGETIEGGEYGMSYRLHFF